MYSNGAETANWDIYDDLKKQLLLLEEYVFFTKRQINPSSSIITLL